MNNHRLTERQRAVWRAMLDLQAAANGIPATMQEIADAAGLKSKADISRYLGILHKRGFATNYGGSGHRAWVAHQRGARRAVQPESEDRMRSPRGLAIGALKDMTDVRPDLPVGRLLMHAADGRLATISDRELSERLRAMAERWRKAASEAEARCSHA